MSFDISLHDDSGQLVMVDHFQDGGTYELGGTTQADLNVTYNYSGHFRFRELDKRRAQDTIAELEGAVARLGTVRDSDYWAATPGNAGAACARLLAWARQHPRASWSVS